MSELRDFQIDDLTHIFETGTKQELKDFCNKFDL